MVLKNECMGNALPENNFPQYSVYCKKAGDPEICLFDLTSSSAIRLPRRQVPRLTSDNSMCCHTGTERGDHVSVCHDPKPEQD